MAVDGCNLCHQPHKSEHDGLLTAAQPALCFDCHERGYIESDPYHEQLDDLTCGRCHDPHSAGNRLLLVDSRTYQRRAYEMSRKTSVHGAWDKDDCALCHRVGESNVLVDDVDARCQSCHQQQMQAPPGEHLHEAVAQGKCTSCHAAHQSVLENLLLPSAEQYCYSCHPPEQIQTPRHPKVARADCVKCHVGHAAPNEMLLHEGVSRPDPGRASAGVAAGYAYNPALIEGGR